MAATDQVQFRVVVPGPPAFYWRTADGRTVPFWVPSSPVTPARRPTRSADRTRSARWRAGTRRTRRAAARRRPARDPWLGWHDLGWVDETHGFAEGQAIVGA